MNRTAHLLGAAAALAVIVVAGIMLLGRPLSSVSGPGPATPSPTAASVPSQSPSTPPIGKLSTFTSDTYGYSIDYPEEWVVRKAARVLPAGEKPWDTGWVTGDTVDTLGSKTDRYGSVAAGPPGNVVVAATEVSPGTTLASWTADPALAVCGATTTVEDIEIDGESGSLRPFASCNGTGVYVLWATVVHGTKGFSISWLHDAGTEASDRVLFEKILATFTFPKDSPAAPTPS